MTLTVLNLHQQQAWGQVHGAKYKYKYNYFAKLQVQVLISRVKYKYKYFEKLQVQVQVLLQRTTPTDRLKGATRF